MDFLAFKKYSQRDASTDPNFLNLSNPTNIHERNRQTSVYKVSCESDGKSERIETYITRENENVAPLTQQRRISNAFETKRYYMKKVFIQWAMKTY